MQPPRPSLAQLAPSVVAAGGPPLVHRAPRHPQPQPPQTVAELPEAPVYPIQPPLRCHSDGGYLQMQAEERDVGMWAGTDPSSPFWGSHSNSGETASTEARLCQHHPRMLRRNARRTVDLAALSRLDSGAVAAAVEAALHDCKDCSQQRDVQASPAATGKRGFIGKLRSSKVQHASERPLQNVDREPVLQLIRARKLRRQDAVTRRASPPVGAPPSEDGPATLAPPLPRSIGGSALQRADLSSTDEEMVVIRWRLPCEGPARAQPSHPTRMLPPLSVHSAPRAPSAVAVQRTRHAARLLLTAIVACARTGSSRSSLMGHAAPLTAPPAAPPLRATLPTRPRRGPLSRFSFWIRRHSRVETSFKPSTGPTQPATHHLRAPPGPIASKHLIQCTDIGLTAVTAKGALAVLRQVARCLQAGQAVASLLAMSPQARTARAVHSVAQHAARRAGQPVTTQKVQQAAIITCRWLAGEMVAHHVCSWLLSTDLV